MTTRYKREMRRTSGDFEVEGAVDPVTASDKTMTDGDNQNPIEALNDDEVLSFGKIAELIGDGVKANTVCARWFPGKVLPAYDGLSCPPLRTESGKPTGFGAKAVQRYKKACVDGGMDYAKFVQQVHSEYAVTNDIITPELVTDDDKTVTASSIALFHPKLNTLQRSIAAANEADDELLAVLVDVQFDTDKQGREQELKGTKDKESRSKRIILERIRERQEEDALKKQADEIYDAVKRGEIDISALFGGK